MKPKSKTATPPEKKDRRGWPKGKPRKPKLSMAQLAAIAEEQEAIRTQKAKPDPNAPQQFDGTFVLDGTKRTFVFDAAKQEFTEVPNPLWNPPPLTASEAIQPGTYPPNMGETVRGPIRAIPHRLGAEWQFMDLDEWRRNPTCVEYLQKLRDEPMFRRFLGMLHGYASRNGAEAPQTETSASIALGKIQGRREILEVIDAAAIADQPIVNPADFPTFAPGEPLGII